MRASLPAGLPFLAILAWVVAIIIDAGEYEPSSILLVGIGWLILATVGTVGLVVVGSRWARRALVGVLATTLFVALMRPLDAAGVVALVATGVGLVVLLGPNPGVAVRRLPSASGPPQKAIVMMVAGLSLPLALGLIPIAATWAVVAVALAGPVLIFLYGRRIRGGLWGVRAGLPLLTAVAAFSMPPAHAIVALTLVSFITYLAWSGDVAIAYRPIVEAGTAYPIPPELAPKEILEGARIDEHGRRI